MHINPFVFSAAGTGSALSLDFDRWLPTDGVNVLTVVEALLQFCCGQEAEFQSFISEFNQRRAKSRLRSWFRLVFKQAKDEAGVKVFADYLKLLQCFLSTSALAEFKRTVASLNFLDPATRLALDQLDALGPDETKAWWPASFPVLIKARAIALAIDDIYGDSFPVAFQLLHKGKRSVRLESGMVFPSAPALGQIRRPIYRVATTDDFLSHLLRLRLFPENAPLKVDVVLETTTTTAMFNNLGLRQPRLQVGIISLGPIDFDNLGKTFHFTYDADMHWYHPLECHPEEIPSTADQTLLGFGKFFGVSTKNRLFSVACALKLMKAADAEGIRMILIPELTFDEKRLHQLRNHFLAGQWQSLRVLVAGSVHQTIDGSNRNRLFVYHYAGQGRRPPVDPAALDQEVFFHDKLGWFGTRGSPEKKRLASTSRRKNMLVFDYEDVRRTGVLKVLLSHYHLIGFAICKDALCRSVSETFDKIGLSYMFVVSLSSRTTDFVVRLGAQAA